MNVLKSLRCFNLNPSLYIVLSAIRILELLME